MRRCSETNCQFFADPSSPADFPMCSEHLEAAELENMHSDGNCPPDCALCEADRDAAAQQVNAQESWRESITDMHRYHQRQRRWTEESIRTHVQCLRRELDEIITALDNDWHANEGLSSAVSDLQRSLIERRIRIDNVKSMEYLAREQGWELSSVKPAK